MRCNNDPGLQTPWLAMRYAESIPVSVYFMLPSSEKHHLYMATTAARSSAFMTQVDS